MSLVFPGAVLKSYKTSELIEYLELELSCIFSLVSQVQISQVTTEAELVQRSNELEGTLAAGSFIEYCNSKIENSTKELEKTLWSFLKVRTSTLR